MSLIIPVTSRAFQEFKVPLDDSDYFFRIQWNERAQFWTLDIMTANKALIIGGMVLVANYSILDQYSSELLPQGKIKVIDQSGEGLDPGPNDLGERVVLFYEPIS